MLFILAFFSWKKARHLVRNGVKSQGEVINLVVKRSSKGGQTYSPQVKFSSMSGPITFTSAISTKPAGFHVGQIVPVIYLPNIPQTAAIDTFFQLWGSALLIAFAGMMFAGVGLFVFLSVVNF